VGHQKGGPISWKAARQGGVTLSSTEAEFVAASQAGKGLSSKGLLVRLSGSQCSCNLVSY